MLARKAPLFALLALLVPAAAIANGCTVKEVDTNNHVDTGSGVTTGGTGGDGQGTGGASATTGTGGQGGGTTTATTGAGGGSGCVGPTGAGTPTKADCSNLGLELFPSTCGDTSDQPPPGKGVCATGFDIYTQGAAEDLETCLGGIAANQPDVCDVNKVADCVTKMYDDACANAQADAYCDALKANCDAASPPSAFDVAQCKSDLKPFNDSVLGENGSFAACWNQHLNDACQDAYDACFAEATTIQ